MKSVGSSATLLGGTGNDTIATGGGIDFVSGDEGDDHVNVRDNAPDIALGGPGNDSVVADGANLDILDGFETVDRPPVAVPPPVDPGTNPVTIGGGTVKVTRGVAPIKVSCPADSSANCTGSLALVTAGQVRFAGLRVNLKIGTARYDIAPGATTAVRVRLASGVQRLADRKGHLKVRAVASTGSSPNVATTTQRLTLALHSVTARRH